MIATILVSAAIRMVVFQHALGVGVSEAVVSLAALGVVGLYLWHRRGTIRNDRTAIRSD